MIIKLIDRNQALVDAWKKEFVNCDNVEVLHGDIFSFDFDCIVSPANSFGFMDGGIDAVISDYIGWNIGYIVREVIKKDFDSELLVGQALTVETGHDKVPYLISAPTMRVPLHIQNTPNVYLAAKAIFLQLKKTKLPIKSVGIPGLGTGVGKMDYTQCAMQMKQAYNDFYLDNAENIVTLGDAVKLYRRNIYGERS